jgi:hypothetical protein
MYLQPEVYKYLQLRSCYGGEDRLGNVTCLFLKFLAVKVDSLKAAVYNNASTTLNEDLTVVK